MVKALKISPLDNVAVVLSEVQVGEEVIVTTDSGDQSIKVKESIPFGHKIALRNLDINEPIIKYGEEIGKAEVQITEGSWVHLHNVYCERGREE